VHTQPDNPARAAGPARPPFRSLGWQLSCNAGVPSDNVTHAPVEGLTDRGCLLSGRCLNWGTFGARVRPSGPCRLTPVWAFTRLMNRMVAAAAAGVVLVLGGCGGGSSSSDEPESSDSGGALEELQAEAEAKAEAQEAQAKCQRQIGSLLRELKGIDSRLDIGMTQPDYNTALGDVSIAYDAIPVGQLDPDCLAVAAQLEDAFNRYIRANNDWSECIDDLYCDIDTDALPGIRENWSAANRLIAKAEHRLARLGVPGQIS